ncbi:MAG: calcium/sodium antiporter [Clostridia bacterium]|nr:calcium/sodium antiporter [Clostridia bacterium]
MFDWLYSYIYSLGSVWQIILFIVFLLLGFFLLIKGADLFVNSASFIARAMEIPAIVVGMTLVAFGTSAPEASVSISSVLSGSAGISIGNIIGSNMFNLLVVLGLSSIFIPVALERSVVEVDVLFMTISSIVLLIFGVFFNANGQVILLQIEAVIMFLMLMAFLVYTVLKAIKNHVDVPDDKTITKKKIVFAVIGVIVGLAGVVAGGDFVVFGAKNIAIGLGASEMLVGLTIVAVGTSLPELITSLVAMRKKENEIALGNVIGSNIFNILFVLGVSGAIAPLTIELNAIIDITILAVVSIFFFIYCLFRKDINRATGIVMVSMYVAYLVYIVLRDFVFIM